MGIGAMRRSYGDCRHQSAQESSGVGLIWFVVHNIGCGPESVLQCGGPPLQ